jgi:hypothetical protein
MADIVVTNCCTLDCHDRFFGFRDEFPYNIKRCVFDSFRGRNTDETEDEWIIFKWILGRLSGCEHCITLSVLCLSVGC